MEEVDTAEAYNRAERLYERDAALMEATRRAILEDAVGDFPCQDSYVLETGCGIGESARILCEMGFDNLVCIDVSPKMVEATKARIEKFKNAQARVESWAELEPETGKYNFVLAQAFIHLFPVEVAGGLLKKLLRASSDRVFLTTTLHETDSEGPEAKDGEESIIRFRHRYSKETWLAFLRRHADRPFHEYEMPCPKGKRWSCVLFYRKGSTPRVLSK